MGKEIVKSIKTIISSLLDIIYPAQEKCVICDTDGFICICPSCESKIKRVIIQDDILSYGYYGASLKALILLFKYHKDFTSGKKLSEYIIRLIRENNIIADVICYVPISSKSRNKRGYNQCEILAKNISNEIGIPVSDCINKITESREQKTLSKEERYKNVQNIFSIDQKIHVENKVVILIDDVVTTGATLNECKKVLIKNNAKKIIVLTIAKSNI